jgi:4-hydroxy-tetrahydrodipicolinate synthase
VILQPPPVSGLPEGEYLRFFGAVADAAPLPVAIQNAVQFLGIGLSNAGLATLHRNHPNVSLLKGEAPAHVIARMIDDTGGAFRVFNGRGGLELPDCLRAGCVGMIPAPSASTCRSRATRRSARDGSTRRRRATARCCRSSRS